MDSLIDPEEVDGHFDPIEMDRFGLDVKVPRDRAEWVQTEPITCENPQLVHELLQLYVELHPVQESA